MLRTQGPLKRAQLSLSGGGFALVLLLDGTCPQTTEYSCSAAAAVTLLARHGIRTTEARMAGLCLTRAGLGTPSLGLYRGLALAMASSNLRPRLIHFDRTSDLHQAAYPCLISVGLKTVRGSGLRIRSM